MQQPLRPLALSDFSKTPSPLSWDTQLTHLTMWLPCSDTTQSFYRGIFIKKHPTYTCSSQRSPSFRAITLFFCVWKLERGSGCLFSQPFSLGPGRTGDLSSPVCFYISRLWTFHMHWSTDMCLRPLSWPDFLLGNHCWCSSCLVSGAAMLQGALILQPPCEPCKSPAYFLWVL